MLKQTINFTDFNGEPRTEDLYFNLTEWELTEIQLSSPEGIQKEMEDAIKAKDLKLLLDFIKMLVNKSYGERDRDGIHFNKSPEIVARFENSAMYAPLMLSLFQDEGARAAAFITGLMPADLVARATAQAQGGGTQEPPKPYLQDHLPKQNLPEAGTTNEAPVIGKVEYQTPIVPATPVPESFRVQEDYMDPMGNVTSEASVDPDFQEFLRRKAAGEL